MTANEQVRAGARTKSGRPLMPKVARIKVRALEMQHAVVFRDHVQISPGPGNAKQLGNGPLRIWNGLQHMPAHGQIDPAIRSLKFENALMFERQPRGEASIPLTRQFQVRIDNVDAK